MRVFFIDPPFQRFMGFYRYYYPIGLAYMAAVLGEQGHTVAVYDAEFDKRAKTMSWAKAVERYHEYPKALHNDNHPVWAEVKNAIRNFSPDVVGISVLSVKIPSALKVAQICKRLNENIIVIVGGDHPTVLPEKILENNDIDLVVRGEGEETICDLISCKNGDCLAYNLIPGISYRGNKGITHNPDREPIPDLDRVPYPAIDKLVNKESYRPVDFGIIIGSRGCPYHCKFCGVFNIWGHRVRFRNTANIIAEMNLLYKNYGTSYFCFRDATFTLSRDRVIELCEGMIQNKSPFQWECLTRADLLDDELIRIMKSAGCVTVRIGIESGSEKILQYIGKNIDLDSVRVAAKLLHKHSLYWSAYLLFGTPMETIETIKETLNLINEINPPFITPARFSPIPGSKIYDELVSAGIISSDTIDWSLESNQRFCSNYALSIPKPQFENIMREIAKFIEKHNASNSKLFKRKDFRIK